MHESKIEITVLPAPEHPFIRQMWYVLFFHTRFEPKNSIFVALTKFYTSDLENQKSFSLYFPAISLVYWLLFDPSCSSTG